jgi:hypothetical protein
VITEVWKRVRIRGFDSTLIRVARSMPGSSIFVEYSIPEPWVAPVEALEPIPLDDGPVPITKNRT